MNAACSGNVSSTNTCGPRKPRDARRRRATSRRETPLGDGTGVVRQFGQVVLVGQQREHLLVLLRCQAALESIHDGVELGLHADLNPLAVSPGRTPLEAPCS